MKTYPLVLEDNFHSAIKHSAEYYGETIKEFILLAIKARLSAVDYIKTNRELQEDIKNKNNIKFEKIDSIEEFFE